VEVQKIFGPPGTGKTHRLLDILESELADGVPPERIAFLTFTREARRVAKDRIRGRFPNYSDEDFRFIRTLHGIAFNEFGLKRNDLIVGASDLKEFAQATGIEVEFGRALDPDEDEVGNYMASLKQENGFFLELDALQRTLMGSLADAKARRRGRYYRPRQRQKVTSNYQAWKQRIEKLDFTDLLEMALVEELVLPVDVVFIDEAQDLSPLQWEVALQYARGAKRVYVAGDDDQAVYYWAGADVDRFIHLPADETVILDKSWRTPQAIHDRANRIAGRIRNRQAKDWKPRDAQGAIRKVVHPKQIDFDALEGSVLVLFRTRYQATATFARLKEAGVPFEIHDRPFREMWNDGPLVQAWETLRAGGGIFLQTAATMVHHCLSVSKGQIERGGRAAIVRDAKKEREEEETVIPAMVTMADLRERYGVKADGPWDQVLRLSKNAGAYSRRTRAR
jgi:DNA helicase-2/ATP-dependent DNA helicase PcrA